MARMQVHLVDGTFELFRAHFGAPPHCNGAGMEVGAARGLLRSLAGMLREPNVTHIGCAFDHVIESFRNTLFDGYKTGEGVEPNLMAQFPLAERASDALGIVTWPMVEFECDDALATAAARFGADPVVQRVIICSPDKDFAQCVEGERIVMWDRLRDKIFDHAAVVEKFGIEPESIPQWLALVGDTADGIPGVPKWGAKSASTMLAYYKTIEAIPDKCESWLVAARGAKTLAENLRIHREATKLYVTLATLRRDANVPQMAVEELRWTGVKAKELRALCDELDADDIARRFEV